MSAPTQVLLIGGITEKNTQEIVALTLAPRGLWSAQAFLVYISVSYMDEQKRLVVGPSWCDWMILRSFCLQVHGYGFLESGKLPWYDRSHQEAGTSVPLRIKSPTTNISKFFLALFPRKRPELFSQETSPDGTHSSHWIPRALICSLGFLSPRNVVRNGV